MILLARESFTALQHFVPLKLRLIRGRIGMDSDFINSQMIYSVQCKQSDGNMSNASVDPILHATKLMLTILRGCTRVGRVTCVISNQPNVLCIDNRIKSKNRGPAFLRN